MVRLSILSCLAVMVCWALAPIDQVHAQTAESLSSEFDFDKRPMEQPRELEPERADQGPSVDESAEKNLIKTNETLIIAQIIKEAVVMISLAVMAVVSLYFVLRALNQRGCPPRDIIVGSGLIVIVFGTIILTLTATTDQQLTAAAGILGAIAGYLFGASQRAEPTQTVAGPTPVNPVPANPVPANPVPAKSDSMNPP